MILPLDRAARRVLRPGLLLLGCSDRGVTISLGDSLWDAAHAARAARR